MKGKIQQRLELSRPLLVDRVPRKGSHEFFEADESECMALAKRFAIPALHSLSARLIVYPWRGGGLKITGKVDCDLTQMSVVSLEEFRQRISCEVERFFLPVGKVDENIEDDADPITNGEIDLGEVAAEALGLELDPYPRREGEVFVAAPENPEKN